MGPEETRVARSVILPRGKSWSISVKKVRYLPNSGRLSPSSNGNHIQAVQVAFSNCERVAQQHLLPVEVPSEIVFRTDLPPTMIGMLDRRALQEARQDQSMQDQTRQDHAMQDQISPKPR